MPARFAARREELDRLRSLISRGGSAILVTGEAGVGKTRLIDEALHPGRLLLRIDFPGARFAAPGMGLRRLARMGGPEADPLEQELAGPQDPGSWKLVTIFRAADALLRARSPGVLVLDDLQWADELTLEWLSHTADLLETAPLSILMACRTADRIAPEVADALAPLRRRHLLELVELRPFGREDVGEMVRLHGAEPHEDVVASLYERSDGLPLAVEELLRTLGAGGELPVGPLPLGELGVPPILAMIVHEQIRSLPEAARSVLAAAALVPQPPPPPLVRAVTGLEAGEFDEAVEAALGSGLLVETGAQLAFRHDLQREAIQDELPRRARRTLHARISRALAEDPAASAGQVANQLIEAGEPGEAVGWLERAADEALGAHDAGNALTHLAAALDLATDGEDIARLIEKSTVAARNANRPEDGLRLVAAALGRVEGGSERGRLLICRARLALQAGDFAHRIEALREAHAELREEGSEAWRSAVLASLALPVDALIPIAERIAMGREGLELAELSGNGIAIARAAGNLAAAEISTGDPRAFLQWSRALGALEGEDGTEAADEFFRSGANWAIGAVAYGRYEEAGEVIRAGIRASAQGRRNPRWEGSFRTVEALRLWRMGRWDEALAQTRHGHLLPEPDTALMTALEVAVAFERERRTDIRPLAEATASLVRHSDYSWASIAHALLMLARSSRQEPRPARGLPALLAPIVATGLRVGWDDLLPAAAVADRSAHQAARVMLGELRPAGPRGEACVSLADGISAIGPADELLLGAAETFESLGEPYAAAQALAAASGALASRGRPAGEIALRAAELFADLGAARSLALFLRRAPRSRSLERFRAGAALEPGRPFGLTPREREVADLARLGYTARAIAEEAGISLRTVEKHLERVRSKLGARRKSDLVRILSDEMPVG